MAANGATNQFLGAKQEETIEAELHQEELYFGSGYGA